MNIRKAGVTDYIAIMRVWERAVLATHHFLTKEDFELFKNIIPTQFLPMLDLYVIGDTPIVGILGVAGDSLEMLFIDAAAQGKGYGKQLVQFAVQQLGVTKVDVNEQNEQAAGFYRKLGFVQTGRSAVDGMGKPYPLVHMVYEGATG